MGGRGLFPMRDATRERLQGYLAHKKHPPPQNHDRSLSIGLVRVGARQGSLSPAGSDAAQFGVKGLGFQVQGSG